MELQSAPSNSSMLAWVRGTFGADAEPDPELTVRGDQWDSLLLCHGPGNEPGVFSAEHFSASRFIVLPNDDVRFGTAPTVRGPGEELGLLLADGTIVWTAALERVSTRPGQPDVVEPEPSPPKASDTSATPNLSGDEAVREARQRKYPDMKAHLAWLSTTQFGSQAQLATALGLRKGYVPGGYWRVAEG